MPNYCNYEMKVVCDKKENIEEFLKVMNADYDYYNNTFSYDRHMFRVFEAENTDITQRMDGKFESYISGYCAWSVRSTMLNVDCSYYRSNINENPEKYKRATTLELESKNLGLEIEVYSEEEGCCFQEHFLIKDGEIIENKCVDWQCYYWDTDEYPTIEDFNATMDTNFSVEDFDEDNQVTIGGFESWDFSI